MCYLYLRAEVHRNHLRYPQAANLSSFWISPAHMEIRERTFSYVITFYVYEMPFIITELYTTTPAVIQER